MGSSQSQLTAEELRDYRELTFLTKKEILHAFKRFKGIAVGEVLADKHARIPVKYIEQMPEFKCNPFRDRLLRVFSSCKDERMSFEDFLDLLSVLCEDAPIDVKAEYAFQIFDMDDDGVLGEDDLAEVIKRLTSWDSGVPTGDARRAATHRAGSRRGRPRPEWPHVAHGVPALHAQEPRLRELFQPTVVNLHPRTCSLHASPARRCHGHTPGGGVTTEWSTQHGGPAM
ncbi:hypothetical protein MRX96_042690 [Rhipicephalus microplus]